MHHNRCQSESSYSDYVFEIKPFRLEASPMHCIREQTVNLKELCNNFVTKNEIRLGTVLATADSKYIAGRLLV